MKLALVTYATDHSHPGFARLRLSAERWGWEFRAFGLGDRWYSFGCKLVGVREAIPQLKAEGFTHIVFTDAYDSIVAGPPSRFEELDIATYDTLHLGLLVSCEKACWPEPSTACIWGERPDEPKWQWWYPNSGGYFADLNHLDSILAGCAVSDDDQRFIQKRLIELAAMNKADRGYIVAIDRSCSHFQSVAHCFGADWQPQRHQTFDVQYDGTVKNLITGTSPVIFHGNGGTDISWIPIGPQL